MSAGGWRAQMTRSATSALARPVDESARSVRRTKAATSRGDALEKGGWGAVIGKGNIHSEGTHRRHSNKHLIGRYTARYII